MRACGLSRMLSGIELVEAGGIEPPSASPPPLALHVYPGLLILLPATRRAGKANSQSDLVLAASVQTPVAAILRDATPDMDPRILRTHRRGSGQRAPYWGLSSECVVVVVGNYGFAVCFTR